MGEVYRARDTKLGRDVALKVLPEVFARDVERMARFRREAQVLASLNHPNIATIHGMEESNGNCALVMELVEGPTLAERIAQSGTVGAELAPPRAPQGVPLHVDEALPIAKQIAEGLEYAHERGVIHRDLKPANVKVRPDGTVKILDFGLAKAFEPSLTTSPSPSSGREGPGEGLDSPTISAAATREGIILGTAAYMSPEQARGKTVDRRCDIWSFGALLFEMLSGQQAFAGEDVSHTLAAVIMKDADWNALPATTPSTIQGLVRRCLTKDPKQRLRDIGDARIAIEETLTGPPDVGAVRELPIQPVWRRALPWGVAAVLALALVGISLWMALRPAPRLASPLRLSVELGADASLDSTLGPVVALSRDGNVLAFAARPAKGGPTQLFVRRLDRTQATALAGTDNAFSPFFSPGGQWIAFFADGKLKKISVAGGAVLTLCDAPEARGGDWGEDGNMVFAPTMYSGLFRVSDAGGTPREVTKFDSSAGEVTQRWPQVLPGGKVVLFTAHSSLFGLDDANIVVQWVGTAQRKVVYRGGAFGRYLPGGYLLYLHSGTLFAAPFNLERLEMTGTPVPVVEGVSSDGRRAARIAFSAGGTVLYVPGQVTNLESLIFWLDRDGTTEPLRKVPARYGDLRLSPDGRRLAVTVVGGNDIDVWVYEWQRDIMSRLTFGNAQHYRPVWTPDGLRVAFTSDRAKPGGVPNLYWQRADGTGEVQRLTESGNPQMPFSWHPTGKFLAYSELNPQTGFDVLMLPMEGSEVAGWKPGKPFVFLNSPSNENTPLFSPDGHWLAYTSDESGRPEVYVRSFPGPGGRWQISTNGGVRPLWLRNGKELLYQEYDGKIMVAAYAASGSAFQGEKSRRWSSVSALLLQPIAAVRGSFDVSPDGKRLAVLLKNPEAQAAAKEDHVTFIFNFTDELHRIAPPAKQ
jgi:serine/threonine-protein kinase